MDATIAKTQKKKGGRLNNQWEGYIYVGIPLLGFVLFSLVPAAISLAISFGDMVGYNLETFSFIGFGNYIEAFKDSNFWHALGISFYATVSQILSLLIAIIVAVFLNRDVKGSKFLSVIYFIPYICSSVATSLMWRRMFNPDYGVINALLRSIFGERYGEILFGIEPIGGLYLDVNWFNEPTLFMPMLIVIMAWSAAGYGIVVLGAALVSVDETLYEAAKIDGAGSVRQFFSVTFPQITPTVYFLLMLGLVNGLQTFDIAMIFVGDAWSGYGPDNMGMTLMLYIYKQSPLNMPYASVMSWLLFIVIFAVQKLNEWLSRRWVFNG